MVSPVTDKVNVKIEAETRFGIPLKVESIPMSDKLLYKNRYRSEK
jgi:hypothetical protein